LGSADFILVPWPAARIIAATAAIFPHSRTVKVVKTRLPTVKKCRAEKAI
jgi:hypothetical protein